MASYTVNQQAVARARQLIDARQYVLKSVWGDVQPSAEDENAFLESHSWEEYALWHLALTDGATDETKARYAFVYGDFRRVHRMGLIACQYRAAEWRPKEGEPAPPGGRSRLPVPGRRMAPQGGGARRPRPPPAPRQAQPMNPSVGSTWGNAGRHGGGPRITRTHDQPRLSWLRGC